MSNPDSFWPSEPGGMPSTGFEPGGLTRALCDEVPEFVPSCLQLAEACDDDPGEPAVLMELADFVADHMTALETESSVLERALATIESHVESISEDSIACEFIAFAFFDSFSPEQRHLLAQRTGPHSRALIEALDAPDTEWESAT
jgi:hypothetical protein